jgi:hypothetical protein
VIRIPSICFTRFGLAVFRVKNILEDNLPNREPFREGVSSKSAILNQLFLKKTQKTK